MSVGECNAVFKTLENLYQSNDSNDYVYLSGEINAISYNGNKFHHAEITSEVKTGSIKVHNSASIPDIVLYNQYKPIYLTSDIKFDYPGNFYISGFHGVIIANDTSFTNVLNLDVRTGGFNALLDPKISITIVSNHIEDHFIVANGINANSVHLVSKYIYLSGDNQISGKSSFSGEHIGIKQAAKYMSKEVSFTSRVFCNDGYIGTSSGIKGDSLGAIVNKGEIENDNNLLILKSPIVYNSGLLLGHYHVELRGEEITNKGDIISGGKFRVAGYGSNINKHFENLSGEIRSGFSVIISEHFKNKPETYKNDISKHDESGPNCWRDRGWFKSDASKCKIHFRYNLETEESFSGSSLLYAKDYIVFAVDRLTNEASFIESQELRFPKQNTEIINEAYVIKSWVKCDAFDHIGDASDAGAGICRSKFYSQKSDTYFSGVSVVEGVVGHDHYQISIENIHNTYPSRIEGKFVGKIEKILNLNTETSYSNNINYYEKQLTVGGTEVAIKFSSAVSFAGNEHKQLSFIKNFEVKQSSPLMDFVKKIGSDDRWVLADTKLLGMGEVNCFPLITKAFQTSTIDKGTVYLLEKLGLSCNNINFILGSPEFDYSAYKEQIRSQYGRVFIFSDSQSHEDEYNLLLENGILAKSEYNLTSLKELTQEELVKIQRPFLWPVEYQGEDYNFVSLILYVPRAFADDAQAGASLGLSGKLEVNKLGNAGVIEVKTNTEIVAETTAIVGGEVVGKEGATLTFTGHVFIMTPAEYKEQVAGHNFAIDRDVLLNRPAVTMDGKFNVDVDDVLIRGADFKASDINIKANNELYIMPATIVEKLHRHFSEKGLLSSSSTTIDTVKITHIVTQMLASGDILIEGKCGNYLQSVKLVADNVTIKSDGKTKLLSSKDSYSSVQSTQSREALSSSWSQDESFREKALYTEIDARNTLNIDGYEGVLLEGGLLKARFANLVAGSAEHFALLEILPIVTKEIEYHASGEKKFSISTSGGRLNWASFEERGHLHSIKEIIPTIIQIEEDFIGSSGGKWYQLSARVEGKRIIVTAPEGITLESAPDIDLIYAKTTKGGIGIGLTGRLSEVSVSLGVRGVKESHTHYEARGNPNYITADFIHYSTDKTFDDQASVINTEVLKIESKIEIHRDVEDKTSASHKTYEFETGTKLGIQSSLGSFIDSMKGAFEQNPLGSKIDAINTGFAALRAYSSMLEFAKHPFSAGLWFYLDYSSIKLEEEYIEIKPGIIKASHIESDSEELRIKATQIEAYNAYFNTNKLIIEDGKGSSKLSSKSKAFGGQIPLEGALVPSASVGYSESRLETEYSYTAKLHVTNHLTLKVDGKASIKGASISANSLHGSFYDLILESTQDLHRSKGFGINFGISGLESKLSSLSKLGANTENRDRNVVREVTSLVGRESAEIIVTHALHLTGAMIASAQENGETGALSLTIGELFIKHIHDYDNGKLLAASISRGEKLAKSQKVPSSYTATFGMHDYFGQTRATIGDGDVIIAKESGESLNRDPNSVQSFEKNIDIKPIKLFYTTDLAKRHNEFMEAGGFAGALSNLQDSINSLFETQDAAEICQDGICQSSKVEAVEQLQLDLKRAEEYLISKLEAKGTARETTKALLEDIALGIQAKDLSSLEEVREYITSEHRVRVAVAGAIPVGAAAAAEALGTIVASTALLQLAAVAALGYAAYTGYKLLKESAEEKNDVEKTNTNRDLSNISPPDPDQDPDGKDRITTHIAREAVNEVIKDFDLNDHEGNKHKGHAIARHVNKNPEWLENRANTDPGPRGRGIGAATSFPDLETANKATKEVMEQNKNKIIDWLSTYNSPKKLTIKSFLKQNVGYGLSRNGEVKNDIKEVIVSLRKLGKEFRVITSYPNMENNK